MLPVRLVERKRYMFKKLKIHVEQLFVSKRWYLFVESYLFKIQ